MDRFGISFSIGEFAFPRSDGGGGREQKVESERVAARQNSVKLEPVVSLLGSNASRDDAYRGGACYESTRIEFSY